MMREKHTYTPLAMLAALLLCAVSGAAAGEGGGRVRLGYVITDEEGNLGVSSETYNLYEGPSVSLERFRYTTDYGLNLSADLKRITLSNRHLTASLSKPRHFGVTVTNHQYRRIYSFHGDKSTRRRKTGGQLHCYPIREVKLYGGYSRTDKHGESQYLLMPFDERLLSSTDYTHTSFNVGGKAVFEQGSLDIEYRRYDFTDDIRDSGDREGRQVRASAFAPIPGLEQVVLSGGYRFRRDTHESSEIELETNAGWATARAYLPDAFVAEYRFAASRSEHTGRAVEIDHYVNTATISRTWRKYGGLRAGYENRIRDEIFDRISSHGFLFSGWFRYSELTVRARFALREEEVTDGATLIGEEDLTRHKVSARYDIAEWGDISLSWQGRIKTNEDIDTRADYDAITAEMNLHRGAYGTLSLTYSYCRGVYENRASAGEDAYEFTSHALSGYIRPIEYRKVQVWGGASYYRSERDSDMEKISGQVGAQYMLPREYQLEARYTVVNFDDFLAIDQYYTGNIVSIYLIKSFVL